jgi:acetylornithine deacetylase/succinyl-diaminopimelate desuccinylase-like protein
MTPARVIDTQRLSTLAHEYEREILQFLRDLTAIPAGNGHESPAIQRIRHEAEKAPFEEIRVGPMGNLLARIGSGKHVIMMDGQADAPGAAGMAGMVYAGKLIHELGMYDDFTLWVAGSMHKDCRGLAWLHALKEGGIHPDCVLIAEPTNLCIKMREAALEGFLSESHPLVQAAIATYETLFELPPVVGKGTASANGAGSVGLMGVPSIGFGPGEVETSPGGGERVPIRHLLQAAQFYAAFPMMFVETVRRHGGAIVRG